MAVILSLVNGVYACACVCADTYTYIHTYIYKHTHTHIHTYTHQDPDNRIKSWSLTDQVGKDNVRRKDGVLFIFFASGGPAFVSSTKIV
jgi:hypothetical protein